MSAAKRAASLAPAITLDFSRPCKSTDNAFIESFNGKLRAECLNTYWFMSFNDARRKCEAWGRDYNEERPHSAIGNKAPVEFINRSGQSARPDRNVLEKAQQDGQRLGAAQMNAGLSSSADETMGQLTDTALALPMQTRTACRNWSDVGSPGSRATSFHTYQVLQTYAGPFALALTRPSVWPSIFATASAPEI